MAHLEVIREPDKLIPRTYHFTRVTLNMRVVGFLAYLFRKFTQCLKFHPRNLNNKNEFQLKDDRFLQPYEAVKWTAIEQVSCSEFRERL